MTKVRKLVGSWGSVCAVMLAGLVLAGCRGGGADPRFSELPGVTGAPVGVTASTATAAGGDKADSTLSDVLQPGQAVTITFADLPMIQPPIEDRIKADGSLTLLQNQTFQAAGKSRGELEREIRKRYVPDFFKTMTVTVQPQRDTRFYYVGGEVKAPSRQIYLSSSLTVLKAIQSCGDFTDFANKKKVLLTRANGRTFTINCVKAQRDSKLDLEVYPDDKIWVPRRLF